MDEGRGSRIIQFTLKFSVLHKTRVKIILVVVIILKKTPLAFSPQANYTD
jgi:hypothetical protein